MFKRFLILEWKSFFRSANLKKDIGMKIFLAFFGIYMAVSLLLLGVGLYFIIEELVPGEQPLYVVNKYLLLWFISELIVRYMMQKIPVLNAKPMLVQNIPRKSIAQYLLLKSIGSYFNSLSLFIVIPFVLVNVFRSDFSVLQILAWMVAVLGMIILANFLNFFIQRKVESKAKFFVPFLFLIVSLVALEYFEVVSFTSYLGQAFDTIFDYPVLALIPTVLAIIFYIINLKILINNLYLDSEDSLNEKVYDDTNLDWTSQLGDIAPFIQLDLRLILRNKRPKSILYLSFAFLLYGLFFFTNDIYADSGMLVLGGIFMTGIFVISFGQFIPAWDSSYYAMMMTQSIPMKLYLKSKISLMYFSVIILTILTTPYLYFGWSAYLIIVASALFNLGFNIPIILYSGAFNKKRIDLDKSQFANYQGTGAAQWLVSIPLIVLPIGLWYIAYFLSDFDTASIVLGVIGIIGILCRDYFLNRILVQFKKRKYAMLDGFKQQNA